MSGGDYQVTNVTAYGIIVPQIIGYVAPTQPPTPTPTITPTSTQSITPTANPSTSSVTPTVDPTTFQTVIPTSSYTTQPTEQSTPNIGYSNVLILLSVTGFVIIAIVIGIFFNKRNQKPNAQVTTQLPIYEKCKDCERKIENGVESVVLKTNTLDESHKDVTICKGCMIKRFDKQNGVCPQCKEPLRWNGNLKEFFGEWYHYKCLYELQQGKQVKEIT